MGGILGDSLGGILGDNLGEGNCESKIASRQWGDNFCRETSICLAGLSGNATTRETQERVGGRGVELLKDLQWSSTRLFSIHPPPVSLTKQNPKSETPRPSKEGGRAKTGRLNFGSLAFAMRNRHFGKECSWILAGKHENVADSGCLRVSQILVNKASGDSVLQVLGNNTRKNCQIVPVLPMYTRVLGHARTEKYCFLGPKVRF